MDNQLAKHCTAIKGWYSPISFSPLSGESVAAGCSESPLIWTGGGGGGGGLWMWTGKRVCGITIGLWHVSDYEFWAFMKPENVAI